MIRWAGLAPASQKSPFPISVAIRSRGDSRDRHRPDAGRKDRARIKAAGKVDFHDTTKISELRRMTGPSASDGVRGARRPSPAESRSRQSLFLVIIIIRRRTNSCTVAIPSKVKKARSLSLISFSQPSVCSMITGAHRTERKNTICGVSFLRPPFAAAGMRFCFTAALFSVWAFNSPPILEFLRIFSGSRPSRKIPFLCDQSSYNGTNPMIDEKNDPSRQIMSGEYPRAYSPGPPESPASLGRAEECSRGKDRYG